VIAPIRQQQPMAWNRVVLHIHGKARTALPTRPGFGAADWRAAHRLAGWAWLRQELIGADAQSESLGTAIAGPNYSLSWFRRHSVLIASQPSAKQSAAMAHDQLTPDARNPLRQRVSADLAKRLRLREED
jgi:hypothetical protein